MRVFEVMSEDVRTVAPDLPASEAWELMRRESVHHLIVKAGPEIVGVLSDRDLGSAPGRALRAGRTVAELMTSRVVTVGPDDTLRKVANVMRGRTIGCLPVLKGRRLIGIVTVSDLLQALGSGGDRRASTSRPPLHWRVPHHKSRRPASW